MEKQTGLHAGTWAAKEGQVGRQGEVEVGGQKEAGNRGRQAGERNRVAQAGK
jgi:hypothetical protein